MNPEDIRGWGTLLAIIATAVMQYKQHAVSEKIHTLVNSKMGAQLKLSMVLSTRLAALTNLPDDIAVAEEAARAYREHETRQAIVDEKE